MIRAKFKCPSCGHENSDSIKTAFMNYTKQLITCDGEKCSHEFAIKHKLTVETQVFSMSEVVPESP